MDLAQKRTTTAQVGNKTFFKSKYDSLTGAVEVRYATEDDTFALVASRKGVRFDGRFEIEGERELQEFAKLVSEAWTEHQRLRPKLAQSVTGH